MSSDRDDVATTIFRIAASFRRLGLNPPEAIILSSHEDGLQFLHEMLQRTMNAVRVGDPLLGKPIEHPDGSVWMEAQVYGMKVRWPANYYATEHGYKWG